MAGAVCPGSFLYNWNSGVTRFVAAISYAIYLTHKGIIHLTQQWLAGFNLNPNAVLIICLGAAVAGAYLLHLVIEKPFMKWRTSLIRKK
jgi:peptidoglycan/LPS O-acetylase OafA/YrhL